MSLLAQPSLQLVERLVNQVQQLQTVNAKCLALVKELSSYKAKAETLEVINNKLRQDLAAKTNEKQQQPSKSTNSAAAIENALAKAKSEQQQHIQLIEQDYTDKQRELEQELHEIQQQLSNCKSSTGNTESQFLSKIQDCNKRNQICSTNLYKSQEEWQEKENKYKEQIETLQTQKKSVENVLAKRDQELKEERDRLSNLLQQVSEEPLVKQLTNDLGMKVDCFWQIVEELKPFVRHKAAAKNIIMGDEEYLEFLTKQIVPKIDGCAEHLQSFLDEIKLQEQESQI
jgi:chromosome segregation ATPase